MKKKKGFTLVELLVVIAILGIILMIAIPKISNVIEISKKNSFLATAKLVAKAGENYLTDNWDSIDKPSNGYGLVVSVTELKEAGYLKNVGDVSDSVAILYNDNNNIKIYSFVSTDDFHIAGFQTDEIELANLEEGSENYSSQYSGTAKFLISDDQLVNFQLDTSGASVPDLASNMIPVYYDDDADVWKKAGQNNNDEEHQWYDYDSNIWANAVTVRIDGINSRADYQNAVVGTTIEENDILTYMVWIPRYKYKITAGSGPRSINVVFEDKNTTKSGFTTIEDTAINTYYTHPAFTFGTKELSGIWVGKFEITGTTEIITTKPSVLSLRSQSLSSFFTLIRNMESTGNAYGYVSSEVDTHIIKNSEWGAVIYLSHSSYGKNSEVWKNPNDCYLTGQAGTSVSAVHTATTAKYNEINAYGVGPAASTTGNVYGIYDMSGGSFEYVMGNFNNYSGFNITYNSGFSGYNGGDGSTTVGISFPDSNYVNVYTDPGYNLACGGGICYGHGLTETANWYDDHAYFVWAEYPWLFRGSNYMDTATAGIFNFYRNDGVASSGHTTRIVQIME